MSISEEITIESKGASSTRSIGNSLAKSIYALPLTILLSGELGAGKTTFAQGLGTGLGAGHVVSPTFALEHRHGERFLHVDLYRLNAKEADYLLHASEHFPGVKLIEWPERASLTTLESNVITAHIDERDAKTRTITLRFADLPIPDRAECAAWMEEVKLPAHVRAHTQRVTEVALACADALLKRGIVVRREALRAASTLHDLLRFVDFSKEMTKKMAKALPPTIKQEAHWAKLKSLYGTPHERAAEKFLAERGYPAIGTIILTHGAPRKGIPKPATIEQLLLSYSDKRVAFDRIVSLDERFDDFVKRYTDGRESEYSKNWRAEMKALERELFPEGTPI